MSTMGRKVAKVHKENSAEISMETDVLNTQQLVSGPEEVVDVMSSGTISSSGDLVMAAAHEREVQHNTTGEISTSVELTHSTNPSTNPTLQETSSSTSTLPPTSYLSTSSSLSSSSILTSTSSSLSSLTPASSSSSLAFSSSLLTTSTSSSIPLATSIIAHTTTVTESPSNACSSGLPAQVDPESMELQDYNDSLTGPPSPSLSSNIVYTPEEQRIIIGFAEQHSLNLASKRFRIPMATVLGWIKDSQHPPNLKYTSTHGRKLTYSAELEKTMADHVRKLIARGERVSTNAFRSYARSLIQEEVPEFTASTGWAQRFLARNNIVLSNQSDSPPTPKEGKVTADARGRPLSYSVETDQLIANYVRQRLAQGHSISNSELRRYAKELIIKENPNFTGSASWAQNFLLRHKLKNLQNTECRDIIPSPSLTSSSPTSLLSAPPHFSSSSQFVSSPSLTSSPSLHPSLHSTVSLSENPLGPATEIHSAQAPSDYASSSISEGVLHIPAEYASEDPMKQALAILTGENMESNVLNPAQLAALQSTLSEITSDSVSLVDILNTAQHLQEQAGEAGNVALITHGLESPATTADLYLGIATGSDAFGGGLTGAAATQVNPNTQAPCPPQLPRATTSTSTEIETNPSSRPLSYAKETDQMLAKWVQEQQAAGKKVTFASLRAYAKKLVSSENPNFNASVGWVTPFLLRHDLDLSVNKRKASRKTPISHQMGEAVEEAEEQMSDVVTEQPPIQVHHIPPHRETITPEQMMVPVNTPMATAVSSNIQPGPSSASTTTNFEGIRAILDQGLECPPHQVQISEYQAVVSLPTEMATSAAAAAALSRSVGAQTNASLTSGRTDLQGQLLPQQTLQQQQEMLAAGGEGMETPKSSVIGKSKISSSQRVRGRRTRHTLSEKLEVVKLMREHSLAPHYVCRMLGIANSTLAGWIKLVQQKGAELEALSLNKKRSNLSGQGRPLTYSRETDEAIAQWVQTQQKMGVQIMPAELAKYAQGLIREENNNFTASSGWAQKFLQRHGLHLAAKTPSGGSAIPTAPSPSSKTSPAIVEDQHEIPAAVQTEEVIAHEYSFEKPYSEETEKQLVAWARTQMLEGEPPSVQALCRHAEDAVAEQNPMFRATLGWAFMFLFNHGIVLDPKPHTTGSTPCTPVSRKRPSTFEPSISDAPSPAQQPPSSPTPVLLEASTPKKLRPDIVPDLSVSPSTGNLCEALLALSNQSQEAGQGASVQAVLQVALQALQHQHQQQQLQQLQQQLQQQEEQQNQHQQQQQQQPEQHEMQSSESQQEPEQLLMASEVAVESEMEIQVVRETVQTMEGEERGGEREQGEVIDVVETVGPGTPNRPEKEKAALAQIASQDKDHNSSNTYFGKPAREFSVEEKEEVVRYANATTLQKAAIKYGVAAPTVWRWRVELKLHQPKYSAMQKKYIIKFAETNSLKEAAQRYGITGKTIQNWRKALQADGELTGDAGGIFMQEGCDFIDSASQDPQGSEVMTYDTQNFQFIVDGGEVVELGGANGSGGEDGEGREEGEGERDNSEELEGGGGGGGGEGGGVVEGELEQVTQISEHVASVPLEVTSEVDIENVGMEYDVISSEGHVAKPRCTPQEKMQILQYALNHSIKEASQKFGVSPGTLYYWKRMKNSGKESKENVAAKVLTASSVVEVCMSTRKEEHPAAPELMVQYSGLSGEGTVLESTTTSTNDQASVEIESEQFITPTSVGASVQVDSATTLQTLSQALAGMGPEALQQLPDLNLLHAVSSLLVSGAAGLGGGGEDGKGKQCEAASEGISSPTDVLVHPFPPQPTVTAPIEHEGRVEVEGEGGGGGGEGERVEGLTPQMVTEEVVTMGVNTEEELVEQVDEEVGGKREDQLLTAVPPSDTLTPLEPVTAVAVTVTEASTEICTTDHTQSTLHQHKVGEKETEMEMEREREGEVGTHEPDSMPPTVELEISTLPEEVSVVSGNHGNQLEAGDGSGEAGSCETPPEAIITDHTPSSK